MNDETKILRGLVGMARQHNRAAIVYRMLGMPTDARRSAERRIASMQWARELRDTMRHGWPND